MFEPVEDGTRVADGLNRAQRLAAEHGDGPLLIVAGAGTGKTRTLVARLSRLLEEGAPPERLLLLTFTRRAANEMLQRVASMVADTGARQVWGGTFHGVAHRLLRLHAGTAGLAPSFSVLDQGDSAELFGLLRAELGVAEGATRFPKKETVARIYSHAVNTQSRLSEVLEDQFPWCRDEGPALSGVFQAYGERKKRLDLVDFDDLLLYWRALMSSPDTGPAIRARFDHVLVDEYQDTNTLQADILFALTGSSGNITVVGDDAQAIYRFRAATVENIRGFASRWSSVAVVSLEQNYRSTQGIIDVANGIMEAAPHALPKRLESQRGAGDQPQLAVCEDEADQSRLVCERILALREDGVDLKNQAVLFRAAHHSDALELELARRRIPFVKYGGLRYLEAAHVKDLMGLLRVLENPRDELAWYRTIDMLPGVGPASARRVLGQLGFYGGDPGSSLDRLLAGDLAVPRAAAVALAALSSALDDCRQETRGLAEQITRLGQFCEVVFPRRYDDADARIADFEMLAELAGRYDRRDRFLAELVLEPPNATGALAGPPNLDDDYLVLSTMHSAKGCEWQAVHVLHAADGNIPSDLATGNAEEVEEERRLLYVAVTRARDHLTVSFPLRYHHRRFGSDPAHNFAQLSRFLVPVVHLFTSPDSCGSVRGSGSPPSDAPPAARAADQVHAGLATLWDT